MTVDEKGLEAAIAAYHQSWQAATDITAHTVASVTEAAMRAAITAYLSARSAEPVAWPDLEEGVADILSGFRGFISARPMLESLLYDIDMLPEQCVTRAGAIRLAGLCEVWRKGEAGQLPSAPAGE